MKYSILGWSMMAVSMPIFGYGFALNDSGLMLWSTLTVIIGGWFAGKGSVLK